MPEIDIQYRAMTPEYVGGAVYVAKIAGDERDRQQNRPLRPRRPWEGPVALVLGHLLETDSGVSWVATANDVVIGYCVGFVRAPILHVAHFFVLPDVQGKGVGRELITRVFDTGRARGASIFSVDSSSSPAAHKRYMSAGMFTGALGYRMGGPVEALCALPEPDASRKRVVDCAGWQDRMAELDRAVWGAERREDHAFYLSRAEALGGLHSFGLTGGAEFMGYGYVDAQGVVGPVAAREPGDVLMLLRMAGDWLQERRVEKGTVYVTSSNKTVISSLLRGGWASDNWSYLMMSEPFGRFDRYVPAGGTLL